MTGLALLGLASVCLGVSDFLGGTLSRRVPLLTVLLLSQSVGVVAGCPACWRWDSPSCSAGGCTVSGSKPVQLAGVVLVFVGVGVIAATG